VTSLVAGFLWVSPAHAQLSVGVSAGGTYSNLSGAVVTNTDSDWGVLIGGFGSFQFETNVALQLEANWVQKGGRGSADGSQIDVDIDYLEFPLTAQLVVPLGQDWLWQLYGGIALAFKTTCDVSIDPGEKTSCDDSPLGWTFESTEWSVPFGTSFAYRFTRSFLKADLRYSYGLSSVVKSPEWKNRSWQFIVRWGFEI
jgi:hypothetical protein